MSLETELSMLWFHITTTNQQLNSTTNRAELARLKSYAEMLRVEYRYVTSNYQ